MISKSSQQNPGTAKTQWLPRSFDFHHEKPVFFYAFTSIPDGRANLEMMSYIEEFLRFSRPHYT